MATILVVEDEVIIGDLLFEALTEEGYTVARASNGQQALACLEDSLPDLVLSDVMMNRMDGRDLIRRMQAHPIYRTIPVILMSAASPPSSRDYPHAAFLAKPFDIQLLFATVARVLNEHSSP